MIRKVCNQSMRCDDKVGCLYSGWICAPSSSRSRFFPVKWVATDSSFQAGWSLPFPALPRAVWRRLRLAVRPCFKPLMPSLALAGYPCGIL